MKKCVKLVNDLFTSYLIFCISQICSGTIIILFFFQNVSFANVITNIKDVLFPDVKKTTDQKA